MPEEEQDLQPHALIRGQQPRGHGLGLCRLQRRPCRFSCVSKSESTATDISGNSAGRKLFARSMAARPGVRTPRQRVLLDRFRLRVEQPQVGYAGMAINFHALATVQGTCRGGQDFGDQSRRPGSITLAPKKLIRTRRASEGSASEPSLRVGLVCARMRNFLAGVIVTLDHAFVGSGLEVVLIRLDSVSIIKHDRHPARQVLASGPRRIPEGFQG